MYSKYLVSDKYFKNFQKTICGHWREENSHCGMFESNLNFWKCSRYYCQNLWVDLWVVTRVDTWVDTWIDTRCNLWKPRFYFTSGLGLWVNLWVDTSVVSRYLSRHLNQLMAKNSGIILFCNFLISSHESICKSTCESTLESTLGSTLHWGPKI